MNKSTEQLAEAINAALVAKPKLAKQKTPKIVCDVEDELMSFADESALKQFMFTSRVQSVIRYDLTGKVTVPIKLITTKIK